MKKWMNNMTNHNNKMKKILIMKMPFKMMKKHKMRKYKNLQKK